MPDFKRAEITTGTQDLSDYMTFLRKLQVGQAVSLPLEEGESTRRVMRSLNAAAGQLGMRLTRLPTSNGSVRFRVLSPDKRRVSISDESKRARVEKAKATRAAHQAEREQVEAMGIDPDAAGPTTQRPRRRAASTARA
jgi:hypothetical protein